MNYELAKQLKDAGFPQGLVMHIERECQKCRGIILKKEQYFAYDEGGPVMFEHKGKCPNPVNPIPAYIPTLSELIKACGEKLGCLMLKHSGNIEQVWMAEEYPGTPIKVKREYGLTPEEAVAKLWLVLNKKDI